MNVGRHPNPESGLLTDDHFGALLASGRTERWRTGTVVFHVGDSSDYVLLIQQGQLKVWSVSARGTEAVLGIRGPGDLVGEFSAIDGGPRSATVTALGQVQAAVVQGHAFRQFLLDHPAAMLALLGRITARVREADQQRIDFGSYDVRERVARLLLNLVDTYGEPGDNGQATVAVPLSQAELAAATSASREAVARALRELRDSGTVSTHRRRITVLRRDLLEARAGREELS
jgi:CRP/FNR family cyclic AMP-dependent transcriptional regulator